MSEKLGPKTRAFYNNRRATTGCPVEEYAAWREIEFASQQELRADAWKAMAERYKAAMQHDYYCDQDSTGQCDCIKKELADAFDALKRSEP